MNPSRALISRDCMLSLENNGGLTNNNKYLQQSSWTQRGPVEVQVAYMHPQV